MVRVRHERDSTLPRELEKELNTVKQFVSVREDLL